MSHVVTVRIQRVKGKTKTKAKNLVSLVQNTSGNRNKKIETEGRCQEK